MRIKSDKQLLLSFYLPEFTYTHFVDDSRWKITSGRVVMPRTLGYWVDRYQEGFSIIGETWDWADGTGGSILLIRGGGLGDLLMLTPTIRHLRSHGVEVTLATNPKYFYLFVPGTVKLIDMDWFPNKVDLDYYDAIVNLNQVIEDAEANPTGLVKHRCQIFADQCKLDLGGNYSIDLNPEDSEISGEFSDTSRRKIVYVMESTATNRNWSYDRHIKLITRLTEHYHVLIVGSTYTELPKLSNIDNFTGKTSLLQLMYLVKTCDLVVTPDTGVFHLAQALGKPIVTYFGAFPLSLRSTRPDSNKLLNLVTNKCNIQPCMGYNCIYANAIAPCIDYNAEDTLQAVYTLCPI